MFLGQEKNGPTVPLFGFIFPAPKNFRRPAPKRTGLEEVYCCLSRNLDPASRPSFETMLRRKIFYPTSMHSSIR